MIAITSALRGLWQQRNHPDRPYLLINDVRGYFENSPGEIQAGDAIVPVHVCRNEWALRLFTEEERQSGASTPKILISLQQLEPDHLPDLQARSSMSTRTVTACDVAMALGVSHPRPLLDRLPVASFWSLAAYLKYLDSYGLERVILASLLDDPSVLTAGWDPAQVLEKLWYEGAIEKMRDVLAAVESDDRRKMEEEFLAVVRPWLDEARYTLVQVALLEPDPPPVLPICLLASILDGWESLTPAAMRAFVDDSELGDVFLDILKDGTDLTGLADWGRRIAARDEIPCTTALNYLQSQVFPAKPAALTEALSAVVKGVGGTGYKRLLSQLVRLLEADGGLLAQGLSVALHSLLGVAISGMPEHLPLEHVFVDLTDRMEAPDASEWEKLLQALQRHQAREQYEEHVSLLEAMVTIHRLTGKAEAALKKLEGLDWKSWLELVDKTYLPLTAQAQIAERLTEHLPKRVNVFKITQQARKALSVISGKYADFYMDKAGGLPQWITDRHYAAGTCRPWLNSDVVEFGVKPLLSDAGIQQIYLVVFDGMSVTNWTMIRDRFLVVKGRELFRRYQGMDAEIRCCTYLPSVTHLCRRAIFAGAPPSEFSTWPLRASEPDLFERCLKNLDCLSADWDREKHYLCYNEKEASPSTLTKRLRSLVDVPARLKAIVFNLQDRLLDKSGISSLEEIMLTYVREVALPHLRRIAAQPHTAVVITADHGFAQYTMKYPVYDLIPKGPGKNVQIHNRCLEYLGSARTSVGPAGYKRIDNPGDFGLPGDWTGADVITGAECYGWPDGKLTSPQPVQGHDHGGLTPEETVVPVAIYITRS